MKGKCCLFFATFALFHLLWILFFEVSAAPESAISSSSSVFVPVAEPRHSNTFMTSHLDNLTSHTSCQDIFALRDGCKRYLKMDREVKAGLGHQITELLTGLRFGVLLRLTPVFTPFEPIQSNHGENYTAINEVLGVSTLMFDANNDKSTLREVDISIVKPEDCGIIVRANMNSCKRVNCFHSPSTTLMFQSSARCMRFIALEHGNWNKANPFANQPTFNVVWHVRVGDIQLHPPGDEFYTNILHEIQDILDDFDEVVHTFIGAWHRLDSDEYRNYTDFFATEFTHSIMANLTTIDSLLHMMHADLLIGSGSSLPLVATLFSAFPVYINTESRKPGHTGWGFLGDYFMEGLTADYSGKLFQHPSEIRARFSLRTLGSKVKLSARGSYPT
jgi:hypothetical protein